VLTVWRVNKHGYNWDMHVQQRLNLPGAGSGADAGAMELGRSPPK